VTISGSDNYAKIKNEESCCQESQIDQNRKSHAPNNRTQPLQPQGYRRGRNGQKQRCQTFQS